MNSTTSPSRGTFARPTRWPLNLPDEPQRSAYFSLARKLLVDLLGGVADGRVPREHYRLSQVGLADDRAHPGQRRLLVDRRQVDQLYLDVLVRRHRGEGESGSVGVVGNLRRRVGEACQDPGLARVRRADDRDLSRPLFANGVELTAGGARPVLALLLELGEAGAKLAAEVLGALVLGHEREHGLERLGLLRGAPGLAVGLLGLVVLGWQVRRHRSSPPQRSAPISKEHGRQPYSTRCSTYPCQI